MIAVLKQTTLFFRRNLHQQRREKIIIALFGMNVIGLLLSYAFMSLSFGEPDRIFIALNAMIVQWSFALGAVIVASRQMEEMRLSGGLEFDFGAPTIRASWVFGAVLAWMLIAAIGIFMSFGLADLLIANILKFGSLKPMDWTAACATVLLATLMYVVTLTASLLFSAISAQILGFSLLVLGQVAGPFKSLGGDRQGDMLGYITKFLTRAWNFDFARILNVENPWMMLDRWIYPILLIALFASLAIFAAERKQVHS